MILQKFNQETFYYAYYQTNFALIRFWLVTQRGELRSSKKSRVRQIISAIIEIARVNDEASST